MQDAESLFYESVQLNIRAKKASKPAKRDALHAKEYAMLHRMLRVDPSLIKAQVSLGMMYQKGEGVQQDSKQAVAWYRKAADQGMALAQCSLGVMYQQGEGVQQDYKQAAAWYRKAADQGMALAQWTLGDMYMIGHGVQQDFKQAALWLQKASEQGSTRADLGLGLLSEMAGDYQAAFASYRAGQAAHRELAGDGMRRCLEKMAESRQEQDTKDSTK
jgi:TPR repeat protein